jgi:hypothetical protein
MHAQSKTPRWLKSEKMARLVDTVDACARDNAWNTEGVKDGRDHGPEWSAMVVASLESICCSLQSQRECRYYGLDAPISSERADAIQAHLSAHYR